MFKTNKTKFINYKIKCKRVKRGPIDGNRFQNREKENYKWVSKLKVMQ